MARIQPDMYYPNRKMMMMLADSCRETIRSLYGWCYDFAMADFCGNGKIDRVGTNVTHDSDSPVTAVLRGKEYIWPVAQNEFTGEDCRRRDSSVTGHKKEVLFLSRKAKTEFEFRKHLSKPNVYSFHLQNRKVQSPYLLAEVANFGLEEP